MKELVEKDDNERRGNELDDEEQADTGTKVARLAVETSHDVHGSLTERNDKGEH